MYETFFGLKREPFSIAPDPHFLYMSERHREALAHLTYGLRRGAGFVLLTGEIGAGKTTVWRSFLEQLPANFDVANVVNPKLAVNALLMRICDDLRVELPADLGGGGAAVDLIDAIHGHLLLAFARGRRTLIVVDEAQALSAEVMEQLRLLTNLDTSDRKLQVLLIGQPELRTILEQPALEPLAQRVVARYHLPALAEAETTRYIAHRMAVAGLAGEVPFEPDALARIHRLCRGVPRRINVLCDRALLLAHTEGKRRIDKDGIDRAALEVFDSKRASTPAATEAPVVWPTWLAAGGLAGAALAAGALLGPLIGPAVTHAFRSTPTAASAPPQAITAPTVASPIAVAAASTSAPAPAPTPAPTPTPSTATAPTATVATPPPAATPSASAAAPAPTSPATATASTLDAVFDAPTRDEPQAWRALAGLWGTSIGPGDFCEAAVRQSLHCYRGRGGLTPIRQLGRPSLLDLIDERGRTAHVLLVGLSDDGATLRLNDNADTTVPLAALAKVWRGDFATLWRAPPGYRVGEIVGRDGPMAAWLGQRLGGLDGAPATSASDEAMKARVFSFQLAHGLAPDGLTGPLTLMQLNRASGVDEPKLLVSR